MYHYTESGLDNVFLIDGYTIHQTAYGDGVSIDDTDGLQKAIGRWLVSQPTPINGAELRFIRLEMERTQRALASRLGTTEQTLRLWEKNRAKDIPGPADRLLRAIYSDLVGEHKSVSALVDRLAELDQIERADAHMRETERGWEAAELCAA